MELVKVTKEMREKIEANCPWLQFTVLDGTITGVKIDLGDPFSGHGLPDWISFEYINYALQCVIPKPPTKVQKWEVAGETETPTGPAKWAKTFDTKSEAEYWINDLPYEQREGLKPVAVEVLER